MRADLDEKRSEYVEFDAQVTVTRFACVMKDGLGGVTRLDTHFGSEMTMSQLYDATIDFEMVCRKNEAFRVVCKKEEFCENKIGVE